MDKEELRRQLLATFKVQLDEHLHALNQHLLALEKKPSEKEEKDLLAELFRAAHCVKGAAHAVDLKDIETLAHRIEDVFGALKGGELSPSPELIDLLLPAVDALGESMDAHMLGERMDAEDHKRILSTLRAAMEGSAVKETTSGKGQASEDRIITDATGRSNEGYSHKGKSIDSKENIKSGETDVSKGVTAQNAVAHTIRVATEKLDALMDGMGELLVARLRTEQRMAELKALQELGTAWDKAWRKVRQTVLRADQKPDNAPEITPLLAFLSMNERFVKDISQGINRLHSRVGSDYHHMALLTDEIQEGVRKVRMVPIRSLFEMFPRMVRDLGRRNAKEVELVVEGAGTEIDRQVMEAMKDPLTHLLRNAVDHGIESPENRLAAGKDRQGTIHVGACSKGGSIVLEVSDDGAGIDVAAVRRAAKSSGILAGSESDGPGDRELINLVFQSGLSTANRATSLSGRGVGLDVVRTNLGQLNGTIDVKTSQGEGTTFSMSLPLTLATSHVLILEVEGQLLAIPITTVERILHIHPSHIGSIDGRPAIRLGSKTVPLVSMGRILGLANQEAPAEAENKIPIIILGAVEKRLAFRVNRFVNTQEVVIKNLGRQLKRVKNVSGATILGTGQVVMILNAADMIQSAQSATVMPYAKPQETKKAQIRRVLVVDDSITTRTLEKNILESAGYDVCVASDGMKGWELVQTEPFDAAVLDVDMPRMNGFDLTEKVKNDDRLEGMPVILVTSLESPNDKIRGMDAGADAYITKGTFDQQELLETIERLVG